MGLFRGIYSIMERRRILIGDVLRMVQGEGERVRVLN